MSTEELIREAIDEPLRKPDGIEITPSKRDSLTIDFDEIDPPRKRRTIRIPKRVKDWKANHFASYMRRLYVERYSKDWNLNFSGVCHDFNKTHDFIVEIKGECSNATLYEYVTWFFENCIDDMISRRGGFYPQQMRQDSVMDKFFDHKVSMPPTTTKVKKDVVSLNEQSMRESMLLGMDRFLAEYGIVIAVNWNLKHGGMSPQQSAKSVYESLIRFKSKDMMVAVIRRTESFSPYPKLRFLDPNWLVKKIDPSLNIDIKVNNRKNSDIKEILG